MVYKKTVLESLFSKVADRKETPTQVFSYAYCEFFNNNYFRKHLRTTASDYYLTKVIYSFSVVSLQLTISLTLKTHILNFLLMTYLKRTIETKVFD